MVLPQPLHILLIASNDGEAMLLSALLQSYAQTMVLIWVTTCQQALALLRGTEGQRRLPRPYLILLDLDLSGLASFDFLQQLRSDPELGASTVFAISASRARADKEAAYSYGIVAYVAKESLRAKPEAFAQLLAWYGSTAYLLPRA